MTTPQETMEEKIRNGRYEETGIYHVDGAEYNVNEDKLVSFIKSEIEKARQEERAELAVKTDIELRRILAEELPKLENKIRQEERAETLREVREKLKEKYYNNEVLNDDQIGDLLSTLENTNSLTPKGDK